MKAKKILMRVVALILVLLMLFPLALRAFASGDVNVDVGGGDMMEVTGQCVWTPGNDGVRVSVYQVSTGQILDTADFSNVSIGDLEKLSA